MRRLLLAGIAVIAIAACSAPGASSNPAASSPAASPTSATSEPPPGTGTPTTAPSSNALRFVAFGDSWPAGEHCNGCRHFVELWADDLETLSGRTVQLTNYTGERERSFGDGKDSTTLLEAVRDDETTRAAIADAEVILISTGPNEFELAVEPIKAGTCGGADDADCIRALGKRWSANFEAILDEIVALRSGRPTVIRLVNGTNPFVSYPEMMEGMPEGFATGNGALTVQLLTDAVCDAAEAHDAVCVDVRPLLNGPSMLEPAQEESPEAIRAVADALLATGIDELD
jgi:hypothetical protein